MTRYCPSCERTYGDDARFCGVDAVRLIDVDEDEEDKPPFPPGMAIGNYCLVDVLGQGGMGTVYRAVHVYIGKTVALKILNSRFAGREEAMKRFLREARAASSINHPNIVDVTDFGPAPGGGLYFVMEYLEGENLEDLLAREGRIELHRAINIVNQIASALSAAHDKGIVHRDLKPANVMLTHRPGRREVIKSLVENGRQRFVVEKEGAWDFVKVLDFGIAKAHDPEGLPEGERITRDAAVFGTPEYMSPEAARGEPVDERADIYSLRILFYDMLTGTVPFRADSAVEIIGMHKSAQPVPPRTLVPGVEITAAAERLIMSCLAKDPAERPQTMVDLRVELRACYGSVAYRRYARELPSTAGSGIEPRMRQLTEELDEWLSINHHQLEATQRRIVDVVSGRRPSSTSGDLTWEAVADDDEPPEVMVSSESGRRVGQPRLTADRWSRRPR